MNRRPKDCAAILAGTRGAGDARENGKANGSEGRGTPQVFRAAPPRRGPVAQIEPPRPAGADAADDLDRAMLRWFL